MLYVVVKNGAAVSWHIGEIINLDEIQDVTEVQADGHELEWVLENISNIPIWNKNSASKSVLNWYGDHAKFIANCHPSR